VSILEGLEEPYTVWDGTQQWPEGWPAHQDKPYAFKPYALIETAWKEGARKLMWLDASIVPIAPLGRIWDLASEHGVWASWIGWHNHEWTSRDAYEALGVTAEENESIRHITAGALAIDLDHEAGVAFLNEFYRLASETRCFCGPWTGEIGVRHRHDQAAASVILWRLGVPLTRSPDGLAYKGGETENTVFVVDGSY
jgi:hypothetical protein